MSVSREVYSEALRPQFHFTSKTGWLNDPVGLHYYKGTYHLFYQHNPSGTKWGNMHWGHATSTDMVHWEEQPDALLPDETGEMWSGSGLVDWHNASGLSADGGPVQILLYTAAGGVAELSNSMPFTQCLAYSNDSGSTWEKYAHNPVIPYIAEQTRDPKAVWHEASKSWVLALYLGQNEYALFTSQNLTQWEKTSSFKIPGCGECPDLFEMELEGGHGKKRWVFWSATRGTYIVGDFDGKIFTPASEPVCALPEGAHGYAAQTWSDIPKEDGRRIQMSWAHFNIPDMPFNCFLTFPCVLRLKSTGTGPRLLFSPIDEIETLYGERHAVSGVELDGCVPFTEISNMQLDIHAKFSIGSAKTLGLEIFGTRIAYEPECQMLSCAGVSGTLRHEDEKISLRVLIDTTSVEIFADDGGLYMPIGVIHTQPDSVVCAFAEGGKAGVENMEIYELKSIWR